VIYKLIIISITSLLLISCGMTNSDVKQVIEKTKRENVSKMEELPKLQEYEQISYESDKLNDPFDIPVVQQMLAKKPAEIEAIKIQQRRPDYDRPREYLENYSLDTLIMVGTLKKRGEMWALVVDRSGIIHRVREGNYLGQNSGKIIKITEDKIALDEIISDQQGGWVTRNASVNVKHQ